MRTRPISLEFPVLGLIGDLIYAIGKLGRPIRRAKNTLVHWYKTRAGALVRWYEARPGIQLEWIKPCDCTNNAVISRKYFNVDKFSLVHWYKPEETKKPPAQTVLFQC